MPDFPNVLGFGNLSNPKLLVKDEALNDSDKTFTVPAGKVWDIHWIQARLEATATVGNRNLFIMVLDTAGAEVHRLQAGVGQTANQDIFHTFSAGYPRETSLAGTVLVGLLPQPLVLPAGFQLHILDGSIIDPTADDLKVYIMGQQSPS